MGTKLFICIPVTASLEMLDSCLGGKGNTDEGTLESGPAVTKSHQLGWWAYEHINPLVQFQKVGVQHQGAGRFSIWGELVLGSTGSTLWCAPVMGEARRLEVSRALTPFKRFHLMTSSPHGGSTFQYHHFWWVCLLHEFGGDTNIMQHGNNGLNLGMAKHSNYRKEMQFCLTRLF